jgi:N-acetylglucosaminyldiphosphoundecaprenol N-acetyl-beta-D-mannosaminyltransferase
MNVHTNNHDQNSHDQNSQAAMVGRNEATASPRRVSFGHIYANAVTLDEAIACIAKRARSQQGGFVVTPNVDHVCMAETDMRLRKAYDNAFLSLPDGQPLLWMAKARKASLPAKVSGSDLISPLMKCAADQGLRVFFLGATPDTCEIAKTRLVAQYPTLQIVGMASPMYDPNAKLGDDLLRAFEEVRARHPDLLLIALGSPKGEYLLTEHEAQYAPAVGLSIGASLDFVAGKVDRAPQWWSDHGLEWVFRLWKEPRRLWRRYLVRDRAILGIFIRDFRKKAS